MAAATVEAAAFAAVSAAAAACVAAAVAAFAAPAAAFLRALKPKPNGIVGPFFYSLCTLLNSGRLIQSGFDSR